MKATIFFRIRVLILAFILSISQIVLCQSRNDRKNIININLHPHVNKTIDEMVRYKIVNSFPPKNKVLIRKDSTSYKDSMSYSFSCYLDNSKELKQTRKLYKFVKRRRLLTFLFLNKNPQTGFLFGSKRADYYDYLRYQDSSELYPNPFYFSVAINNRHNRYVNLETFNYRKTKAKYILCNLPWQIIPSWRLYNKCKKAINELNDFNFSSCELRISDYRDDTMYSQDDCIKPSDDLIEIAKSALEEKYNKDMNDYKPFQISHDDGVWIVQGRHRHQNGELPYVEIDAATCKIIKIELQ